MPDSGQQQDSARPAIVWRVLSQGRLPEQWPIGGVDGPLPTSSGTVRRFGKLMAPSIVAPSERLSFPRVVTPVLANDLRQSQDGRLPSP